MIKHIKKFFDKAVKNFSDFSFRKKIMISYIFCIMIPLMIFGVLMYNASARRIIEERCDVATQSVKQYNKIFDEYINHVDAISLLPYINKDLQNYLLKTTGYHAYQNIEVSTETIVSLLENQFQTNKYIDFISIASLNGEILSQSKYGRVKAEYQFLNNNIYKDFFSSTGEITLSPLHSPKYMFAPKKQVVTVGRRILDFREGIYSGYILIDFSTDIFKRACEQVTVGDKEHILITDQKGNLLYSSKNSNNVEDQKLLDAIKLKNKDDKVCKVDGKSMIVAKDVSSYTGWQVYSVLPYSSVLEAIAPFKSTFILLSIFCMILGVLCSIIISKNITNPIRRLQKTMKQIEEGNTKLRAQVENSSEVGQLSQGFNQLLDKIEYLMISIKSIELKKREAQLEALKSKINPHFLYNTLESIRMMAIIEDKKEIARAIEALADLFRYTIRLKKDIINVKTELEYIQNYILLQKIRYEDNLEVVYDIDETLLEHMVLKLTLQPIVENALKYGVDKSGGRHVIKITISKAGECILMSVEDDGDGMTPERLQEVIQYLNSTDEGKQSIGLKNINQRIQLYFGADYGLQIESVQGKGTIVTLKIPDYESEELVMKNAVSISGGR